MDYDDQLERALSRTPDSVGGGSRFEVPEPDVRTEGNVTVYENFEATYDRLNREPRQLLKFLQSELGTSAGIDEKGRARLTGEFKTGRVADALSAYVEGYVTCSECGSPDTHIVTEQGTDVLKCDACGALSALPG
jgi:translation initiation factor 2 subunit 2